jgi:iron(III) transport system permease protein
VTALELTRTRLGRKRTDRGVILAVGTVPALIIAALLLVAPIVGFTTSTTDWTLTLEHYSEVWADPVAYQTLANTLLFVLVSLAVAIVFGVPLAWMVERTDLGGTRSIWALMMMGILIPGFFTAMGWLYLLHPRIGFLNKLIQDLTGSTSASLNIQSLAGMGFVEGLQLTPLLFMFFTASLRNMNASFEEAAAMHGARDARILRSITLPLALPGLMGALLYCVTVSLSAFDTPLILGLADRNLVFSTYLYLNTASSIRAVPVYGPAAAFATFMLVVAFALTWGYSRLLKQGQRFAVVTGKSDRTATRKLGRWKWPGRAFAAFFFMLSLAIPLALLLWTSFQTYVQPFSLSALENASLDNYRNIPWPDLGDGLKNTLVLMVIAPVAAIVISLIFSWLSIRSGYRFRMVFENISFLPQAVPIVIITFAASYAALFLLPSQLDLRQGIALIVIVISLSLVSFGTRITNSALLQIHPSLEESAQMAGARMGLVFWKITIPLMKTSLISAWVWIALLVFRQLTVPLMLVNTDNGTASVVTYTLFRSGESGVSAAISIISLIVILPLIFVYFWITSRESAERDI